MADPTKWRRKPGAYDAFQMTHERRVSNVDWPEWLNRAWNEERGAVGAVFPTVPSTGDGTVSIGTLEGPPLPVNFGDWIVKGSLGGIGCFSPQDFAALFEPADTE